MEKQSVNNTQIKSIIGLSWGHFNIDLYSALLVPLYPLFVQKLGINLAIISFIIAFGHLVSSMMQPVFGFVADKLRHRFFMVWGLYSRIYNITTLCVEILKIRGIIVCKKALPHYVWKSLYFFFLLLT